MKVSRTNIYQIYVNNGCRFGFFVRRDTWESGRCAKVIGIEHVEDGQMIQGTTPNCEAFKNTTKDYRHGKIMWPRLVTLEADWLVGGIVEIDSGGDFCWEQVSPSTISPGFKAKSGT